MFTGGYKTATEVMDSLLSGGSVECANEFSNCNLGAHNTQGTDWI